MRTFLAASLPPSAIILAVIIVVLVFSLILVFLSRYRRCPSDKVMVIYGKVKPNKDGSPRSANCIHGGAAFIMPVIQAYEYLDLTPMSISVDLKNALSRQNIRIDVPARFTVGISTEPGTMQNAAERLLGLKLTEIQELAKDIIFGQMRLIIATMDIEEKIGRELEFVAGGSTTSYPRVLEKNLPRRINLLRIGEAMLLARDLQDFWGCDMSDMHRDVFTLQAEVIEAREKPTYPVGKIMYDAFERKPEFEDRGIRKRALIALGRADFAFPDMLIPRDKHIQILGASSDLRSWMCRIARGNIR